jgi:glycosyltransferase involved in cell wall biosynthesis
VIQAQAPVNGQVLNDASTRAPSVEALGVSVVICSHNGEKRLPPTIAHLKRQKVVNGVKWEVLLIDNASSDNTAAVARQCWNANAPAPLRIVHEPRLGLGHARERAFEEAQYEIVTFIDDDNWVTPEWVAIASRCMSMDPQLGAIGSANTAVADRDFPTWFSRYRDYYAAGDYPEPATTSTSLLIGAGMTIRRNVWLWLKMSDFHPHLIDRIGTRLTSSGDLELGYAIRLAGWNIRVEPRLALQHYMPPERLRWSYLRRLLRGIGESHTILDSYLLVSQSPEANLVNRLHACWWFRLARETANLVCNYSFSKCIGLVFRDFEGDDQVPDIELRIGRLLGLVRLRSRYRHFRLEVARAPWRRVDSVDDQALSVDSLLNGLSSSTEQ